VLLLVLLISNVSAAPTVTTDKADYFFFETVTISGGGFASNTHYDVPVIRPDGSIVTGDGSETPGWDRRKTDGSGSFTYLYQLSAMAGTYEVRVYAWPWNGDLNGSPLASVTFTDAPPGIDLEQCRNGTAASPENCVANMGNGWGTGNVGDLQGHLVEGYSIPYRAVMENLPTSISITLTLGYDIKHSGAHAIDFLTHYDRLEPHAPFGHAAETVTPTDGVLGISATTTTFAIPAPSSTSPCASPVSGQPTTSFSSLPAGERVMTLFGGTITAMAYTTTPTEGCLTDAQAETQIDVTFTVDSATAVLSWGGHIGRALDWGAGNSAGGIAGSPYHMRLIDWSCALPCTSLPNLGNQDRSLSAGTVEPAGTVIINKVAVGGDDTFSFTAAPDGIPTAFDITTSGGTGSQTFDNITAATRTVTESGPPAGWVFTSLVCDDPDSGTTVSGQTATIDLDSGETVTCTYTNTKQGTVIIEKTCVGGNDTFGYTGTGAGIPANFNVTCVSGSGSQTFANIDAGAKSVTEAAPPAGWVFTSLVCVDPDSGTTVSGQTANIDLDPAETVTCTYTNTKQGTVIIEKTCVGGNDTFGYTGTGTGIPANFNVTCVSGSGSQTFANIDPGAKSVTEAAPPAGWVFSGLVCVDPDSGTTVSSQTATIDLDPGETVTCTYTNTKQGTVIIEKTCVGGNDTFAYTGTGTGIPANFNITCVSGSGSQTFANIDPGAKSVTEAAPPAGWAFTSLVCVDPDGGTTVSGQTANIDLDPGETVTCTYTNTPNTADVKILSQTVFAADCASPAPNPIPVSQNTTICLRKVIHNNGPAGPVDVSISKTASAPPDCTITPNGPIAGSETNLQVNVDRNHDELFTIQCTEPSFHTFSFTNILAITTPGITDPTPGNNSASTDFTAAFTATVDLKIVSQTVGTKDGLGKCTNPPPAQFFVSQDTDICVRKVIHNNGPLAMADAIDTNTVSVVPPDCTAIPPQDVELIFDLPINLDVTFDEFFTIHCTDRSFHTFSFTNILDPVEHVTDTDPINNTLVTDIVIPVIDFTDVAIVSHEILSGPSQIDVSENAIVTIRKVIRNNGPISPVDLEVVRTFDPPPDCTAVPVGPITVQVLLTFGQDKTLDEEWTIHCTQRSFHTFNFINDLNLKDPHLQDSIPANNSGDSPFVFAAIEDADVKIVSQTILAADCASPAPATIPVSQNTNICLRKVIRNDGPFGPVDVTIAKTATAPPDCTVTPSGPIAGSETNLQVNVDRNHDELFTIHCTKPSFHTFSFTNDISLVPITHVADPDSINNSATTDFTPGFTTPTDVKMVSQTILAADCASPAPTTIPVSQNTNICLRKVIRNDGPFGPVDVSIAKTATAPPDCTVTPSGPIAGSETNLQVNVDRNHDELFTIHCTKPSFHTFSFTNDISIETLHIEDSVPANNSQPTNFTPSFTAQADVEIVSQTVLAADCTSPAPTTITVSQDTNICLRKVVRNNGLFGPVDVSVSKTAEFVPGGGQQAGDATVIPTSGGATLQDIPVSQSVTHNEVFTLHCFEAGDFEFLFSNSIAVVDLHVSDPIAANDLANTSFVVTCEGGPPPPVGGIVEFLSAAPDSSERQLADSGSSASKLALAVGIAVAGAAAVAAGVSYVRRQRLGG